MSKTVSDPLKDLRARMVQQGVSAYIVPSADPHQSEYVADHWKCREWISGFTGSAGTVVILPDAAGLWTDGRYFIQAERELAGSGIALFKMHQPDVPELIDWIYEQLPEGATVGVDGRLITIAQADKWEARLEEKDIQLETELDLIAALWTERPPLSKNPARLHPEEYAGCSATDKLNEMREAMLEAGADVYLLSSLPDIAWLFNLRGDDMPMCPVLTAYALIEKASATLFVDEAKLTDEVRDALAFAGVGTAPYDAIGEMLSALSEETALYCCEDRVSAGLWAHMACMVLTGPELTALPKARKNAVQLKHWRRVMELDGVAMVRFWMWLEEAVPQGGLSECDAADRLEAFRRDCDECLDLSFTTISAYGPNAAVVHYSPQPERCATLEPKGLYLLDSGGQYPGGTTDITRTLALGEVTDEERTDYTLVLMGHIHLSRAVFRKGAAGYNLDLLARQPLWEHGLDFAHGTGHGVGQYLSVHEGPQNISPHKRSDTLLEPGMVVTIEPGLYREGRHGIRTENVVVVEADSETGFGTFYRFRPLTLCPIDTAPLNMELLSESDIEWLNAYHRTVYEKLAPHLDAKEAAWLKTKTRPLKR
jgi:Xaa-Pro aminopeptidase